MESLHHEKPQEIFSARDYEEYAEQIEESGISALLSIAGKLRKMMGEPNKPEHRRYIANLKRQPDTPIDPSEPADPATPS